VAFGGGVALVYRHAGSARRHVTSPEARVLLLGTGTPIIDPARSGAAVAVLAGERAYVVDFGPGVVRRAGAAVERGYSQLAAGGLTRAFCTHLHSDHTAGYPDLILTPAVVGRRVPLQVYGPPGIGHMTRHILEAYRQDIEVRVDGLERGNVEAYKVVANEIEPGLCYADERVSVHAFAVKQGEWPHAFGFRFEADGRVIVISGDTAPTETLLEEARGCDVLVHEVYSLKGFETRSPGGQRYHAAYHTSSRQVGELAAQARPRLLVLYHQLLWGATREELLAEVREVYDGPVAFANDLDVY
jgi:ribonuclease BN (tRNA processing enzyme)